MLLKSYCICTSPVRNASLECKPMPAPQNGTQSSTVWDPWSMIFVSKYFTMVSLAVEFLTVLNRCFQSFHIITVSLCWHDLSFPTHHMLKWSDGPSVLHHICDLLEQRGPCGGRESWKQLEMITQLLQLWIKYKMYTLYHQTVSMQHVTEKKDSIRHSTD